MSSPKYEINEVVYLKESAAIGFLESVRISGIHRFNDTWIYTIVAGVNNPQHPPVYGDRISHVNNQTLYFSEDEFVTHCDALLLAEANALSVLKQLQSQRASICTESDPTGAS